MLNAANRTSVNTSRAQMAMAGAGRPGKAARAVSRTRPSAGARLSHGPAAQSRRLANVITRAAASAAAVDSSNTEQTTTPLPIVFVSAEVAPWSKTGGLGDVIGGLPIELVKRGHKVITVSPRYDQYSDAWDTSVVVNIDGEDVRFFHSVKQGVHRVWIDHPWFLAKVWGKTGSKLYGPKSGADFVDNHRRFALFSKAAIEASRVLPFGFGEDAVFVANDWHSSLVPVLLKDVYQAKGEYTKSKVALCIHNIAFQGRMWEDAYKEMGLPASSFAKFSFADGVPKVYTEKTPLDDDEVVIATGTYKKINWLKAGILAADKVLTVSPNYAAEITADASGGVELDNVLRAAGGVEGIVNGMDTEEWDPRVDKFLTLKYDKTNVYAGKAAAKEALQAETGLPVNPDAPLFAFIGRLEEQKGVDILLAAVPQILAKAPNAQIVILGTGKAKFEALVKTIGAGKPNVKGVVKFSAPLAHYITAGADFILVPSRFEPCGLIQLHAMQYGTVPIVASTGGLVDTVKEGVTGFHIGALDKDDLVTEDVEALSSTAARAAAAYSTPLFKQMVYNCISQDLGWSKPAKKWEGVLEQLYFGGAAGKEKASSIAIPVEEPIPGPVAATDKPLSAAAKAKASKPAVVGAGAGPSATAPGPAPKAGVAFKAPAPKSAPTAAPGKAPGAAPAAAPTAAPKITVPPTLTPVPKTTVLRKSIKSTPATGAPSAPPASSAPTGVPTPAKAPVGASSKP